MTTASLRPITIAPDDVNWGASINWTGTHINRVKSYSCSGRLKRYPDVWSSTTYDVQPDDPIDPESPRTWDFMSTPQFAEIKARLLVEIQAEVDRIVGCLTTEAAEPASETRIYSKQDRREMFARFLATGGLGRRQ